MTNRSTLLIIVLAGMLMLVLAACGGGATPAPTPEPTQVVVQPTKPPPPTPTEVPPPTEPPAPTEAPVVELIGDPIRGGVLYDKWWKVLGLDEPTEDHPLWATQTTNTRSGSATWRCKECHGWDYLGKDGAYGSGSHLTGFVGVYDAAQIQTVEEYAAALKGATSPDHDFSSVLDEGAINDLATFLKEGLIDVREYIDYEAEAPKSADQEHGKELFNGLCVACHGPDGTTLNFGSPEEPEYVGTVASENPQEFLHKDRFGQPGSEPPMPATIELGWSIQDVLDVLAYAQTLPTEKAPPGSLARGGRLYDKWWAALGVDAPEGDHPLWATQTTNTRSGDSTWRCKECHGWDYLGKDGAYGSGSHLTGFPGVYDAAQTKTVEELAAALKGATSSDHDFSSMLDEGAINDLATFLKEGLIDVRQYIDYEAEAPKSADQEHGKELFSGLCVVCHGPDGTNLNFGSAEEPEYLGTVASENPQEFLHKDRFGQPGSEPPMPATIELGWSIQDVLDVLSYAQTLPTEAP
ncbi:MAG: c-type cytochrome [Anaerolineae bacterium]